jgi:hypothetical protein
MKMTWVATGALVAAAAFAFPAGSSAQGRRGDVFGGRDGRVSRDGDAGYGLGDTYRIGYQKGVEDGQKRGEKDRSKGDRGLIHDSKYRKGDAGYKKSYGPKQDYIAGYRDGYEQAYLGGIRAADTRGRGGALGRGRNGRADRNDPYGYGRDGRYGRRDRSGTDPYERDGRYGTDPYERDDRDDRDDDTWGRDDRYGRDDDDDYQEDGVIYEEPPGRW